VVVRENGRRREVALVTRPAFDASRVKGAVVAAVALLVVVICWLVPAPQAGGETGVIMELPSSVGPLLAFSQSVSPAELAILPPDTQFARKAYGLPGDAPVQRITCSIVLSGKERRSIHRPERCLPAQGWRIDSSSEVDVPLESGRTLATTALLLERPATLRDGTTVRVRQYFIYWFVAKDLTTPSQTTRILLTNWLLLTHRVTERWAYVFVAGVVLSDLAPGQPGPDETLARLKEFIRESVPFYMKSEMQTGGR
jgi:hypothetical protein